MLFDPRLAAMAPRKRRKMEKRVWELLDENRQLQTDLLNIMGRMLEAMLVIARHNQELQAW